MQKLIVNLKDLNLNIKLNIKNKIDKLQFDQLTNDEILQLDTLSYILNNHPKIIKYLFDRFNKNNDFINLLNNKFMINNLNCIDTLIQLNFFNSNKLIYQKLEELITNDLINKYKNTLINDKLFEELSNIMNKFLDINNKKENIYHVLFRHLKNDLMYLNHLQKYDFFKLIFQKNNENKTPLDYATNNIIEIVYAISYLLQPEYMKTIKSYIKQKESYNFVNLIEEKIDFDKYLNEIKANEANETNDTNDTNIKYNKMSNTDSYLILLLNKIFDKKLYENMNACKIKDDFIIEFFFEKMKLTNEKQLDQYFDKLLLQIKQCIKDKRILIIPMTIGDVMPDGLLTGHAISIIIMNDILYCYSPNIMFEHWENSINEYLTKIANKLNLKYQDITLMKNYTELNLNTDFCFVWNLYFVIHVLKYKNIEKVTEKIKSLDIKKCPILIDLLYKDMYGCNNKKCYIN